MEGLEVRKVSLTRDAAIRVIETVIDAGYTHGIGYWGTATDFERDGRGRLVAFTVTENEPYHEQDKARKFRITIDKIGPAIATLMNVSEGGFVKEIAKDAIDGPLCDGIIQAACFGDILYG